MTGPREAVLRERGLDEDDFAAIDAEFQDALSDAMTEECDGVPPLLTAYDHALRRARSTAGEEVSLEQFASLTRELESGVDAKRIFETRGMTFERYVRASEHWTAKLATDPDLAQRFIALRGR